MPLMPEEVFGAVSLETIKEIDIEEEQGIINVETLTEPEHKMMEEKCCQFENELPDDDTNSMDNRGLLQHFSGLDKHHRRNLIFDEERFEETFLKCFICRESYNHTDKLPKILQCHHTFCVDCLCQMFRVEGEFRQSLTSAFRGMPMAVKLYCPTCRDGFITSEAELRRLPNDHTITELLSFVKDTGRNDIQYCIRHQMQPLNFFCEPCIQPVCCDCTVIDHKESKGHIVVNVGDALSRYSPILDTTLDDICREKTSVADKQLVLTKSLQSVDDIQANLRKHVRSVFDHLRVALDEREKELYDISDREIISKRQIIKDSLNAFIEYEASLDKQFTILQQAKDDRDISQMFIGHKNARKVLVSPVSTPVDCMQNFNVAFQFSSQSNMSICRLVSGFGNIVFFS